MTIFVFLFFWYFMSWRYRNSLNPKRLWIKLMKCIRFHWLFIVKNCKLLSTFLRALFWAQTILIPPIHISLFCCIKCCLYLYMKYGPSDNITHSFTMNKMYHYQYMKLKEINIVFVSSIVCLIIDNLINTSIWRKRNKYYNINLTILLFWKESFTYWKCKDKILI